MNLEEITPQLKNPNENFQYNGKSLNYNLVDFWAWNQSDLVENRNRGILSEFIVRQALGLKDSTRIEWDSYDLITSDNIKIEVKSAAYIQAWKQKKLSTISFEIAPKSTVLEDNNFSGQKSRNADIYIFCLLDHKIQSTIDPMKLEQWVFYIVSTKALDASFPFQKTISISSILTINHEKCSYGELKQGFDKIKATL